MAVSDIELFGDKQLVQRFQALERGVGKKVLRRALREAGRPVLASAKQNAPVDTGKLKDTLKLRAKKSRRNTYGVEIRTGTRSELGIDSTAGGFYPASQEFGWGEGSAAAVGRALGGGGSTGNAQPYMRPALDNNRSIVGKIVRVWTWKGIKDLALAGGITRTAKTK